MNNDTLAAEEILLGRVLTLDANNTVAEAIAVAKGRITAVGNLRDLLDMRDADTVIHDYTGSTIIPGFNDTHGHMDAAGMKTLRPSLAGARSIQDILERVRELTDTVPAGEWIVTSPVGEPPYFFDPPSQLAEERLPNRWELDSVAPEHPVCLPGARPHWGGLPCHAALNSLALRSNGIDRYTRPRVPGLEIEHDADGEPTGVIRENGYYGLMEADLLPAVPRFTLKDRLEAIRRAQAIYHAAGTTSVYEGHGSVADVIAAYRDLQDTGELTMRMSLVTQPTWGGVDEAAEIMRDWLPPWRGRGMGDAMLRTSGVYIGYGGSTAIRPLVRENRADGGWSGILPQINDPAEFEKLCMLAGRHNLRMHTVVSDKLHEIVPIMERVAKAYPIGERRWVLEHVSRSTPADLERLKALGVAVTLIPPHYLWKAGSGFLDLPEDELDYLSPAKQLCDLGARVSAGTDGLPHNPLTCMWAMVTRQERTTGRVLGQHGIVSNETALRLLTHAGAWLTFEEHEKGRLLPGYYADLTVLSGDPVATSGDALLDIRCQATMVNGRWVYPVA